MQFIGEFKLSDKESFIARIKPSFSINKFSISSKIKGYSKDHVTVFLFGKLSDIDSKKYDFNRYKNKQENLICELYKENGKKFIKLLDGYFLIILYDKKTKSFFIFNNRYSNTYCYYYITKSCIIFADNIKSILRLLKKKPRVNMDVINLFLNSGFSFSHKTNFKNIYRMIPGFYLKAKNGKIEHKKYSEMIFNRNPVKNLSKALDSYEFLWQDAIRKFTQANKTKELGSALSGGLDTSWVVYTASKAFNKPVHTYNCYYEYSLFNEIKPAEFVTKKCKGIFHKIKVTPEDLNLWPEVIRAAEEPVLSTSISVYKMIKESSKDVDTFLTGDGGNNIYHHLYPVSEIHRYIHFLPHFIRKPLYYTIDTLAKLTKWERLWELKYALYPFSFKKFYKNFYKNLICYRHFTLAQRKKLLKQEHHEEVNEEDLLGYIPIRKKSFDNDLIHNRFVHGNMEYVSTFHEKFAKKFNIKLFPPYQNQKIMDFINSLPFSLLFKANTFQKLANRAYKMYFQKLSLKRHFPKSFVDKTGQPFDQPFHGWLERRPEVVKLLFKRLKKRGWYNNDYLDKLYHEHKKQYQHKKVLCQLENHGYRIMALLALEIWCIEFLDNYPNKKIEEMALESYLKQ